MWNTEQHVLEHRRFNSMSGHSRRLLVQHSMVCKFMSGLIQYLHEICDQQTAVLLSPTVQYRGVRGLASTAKRYFIFVFRKRRLDGILDTLYELFLRPDCCSIIFVQSPYSQRSSRHQYKHNDISQIRDHDRFVNDLGTLVLWYSISRSCDTNMFVKSIYHLPIFAERRSNSALSTISGEQSTTRVKHCPPVLRQISRCCPSGSMA